MKLYSSKEDKIIKKDGCWIGHIDDYYNKYFDFLRIDPMIIPLDDEVADIVDKCNNIDWNIFKSINIITNYSIDYIIMNNLKSIEDIKSLCDDNQKRELDKFIELINITNNVVYEFNDLNQQRRVLLFNDCDLKPFEGQKDIDIYSEKLKEVNEFNEKSQKEMNEFLLNKNAFIDYFSYNISRRNMFQSIGYHVSKLKQEGKF